MSAGPKSVAPVSRPATAMTADIIRCSMKGRAMITSIGSHSPAGLSSSAAISSAVLPSIKPLIAVKSPMAGILCCSIQASSPKKGNAVAVLAPTTFFMSCMAALSASRMVMCTCLSISSS